MQLREEWNGFAAGHWTSDVNVRDFIQRNYTPYDGGKEFLIDRHLLVVHQLFGFGLGCVIKDFLRTTVFELLQSLHHISIGFCELPAGEFMSDGLCAGLCFLPVVVTVSDKVGGR